MYLYSTTSKHSPLALLSCELYVPTCHSAPVYNAVSFIVSSPPDVSFIGLFADIYLCILKIYFRQLFLEVRHLVRYLECCLVREYAGIPGFMNV